MRRRALTGLLCAMLCCGAVAAGDRLHLENGGAIDVDSWWVDGDWIRYESAGGTIGVPRALVVRIERDVRGQERGSFNVAPDLPRSVALQPAELLEKMQQAKEHYEAREFDDASRIYHELMLSEPSYYGARLGFAASEMAMDRDGAAISAVVDGLIYDPQRAPLLELLGDLRYREDRPAEALRAWRSAFESASSDRLRDKIIKVEREMDATGGYDFATTPHFNLRYDGRVDLDIASAVMDHLEEQYWTLADRFAHAPAQPITVVLYPDREFRELTNLPEWVGGVYDGKIRVPLGGLRRLDPSAQRLLIHELTHAVVHSKTHGNCPRWLHEGLAQMAEGRSLDAAERAEVAEQMAGRNPASWESDGFSYPIALSQARFLESLQGFDGLIDLLEHLEQGLAIEEAVRAVYRQDFATLCRRWAASLPVDASR